MVVIEHNLDIIKTADYVIDLGPEGGELGGYVVAVGTPEEVAACEQSYTGKELARVLASGKSARADDAFETAETGSRAGWADNAQESSRAIRIHGAMTNNLKRVNAVIPKNSLTVVAGPSGARQDDACIRHSVRGGTEAVCRIPLFLCTAVPRSDAETAGGESRWSVSRHRRRPEVYRQKRPVDRRHYYRDLRLPQGSLCQDRDSSLPKVRRRDPDADHRSDCEADHIVSGIAACPHSRSCTARAGASIRPAVSQVAEAASPECEWTESCMNSTASLA